MSDVAIRVENISKQYFIGGTQQQYPTFRDALTNIVVSPFRRAASLLRGHSYGAAALDESFWALKDVSFEVKRGEVVGIIGRNGAGKSTLLKILSRITEPTSGYADIYGRVGSLLEVGTGFHPELTGRENVYLNGSILGMKHQETRRRFDEIVEFAGVEKFIDTPVKHYSSGMQVRLAFAVAAHLEPEILIVDEVLAVGDASFQKKCMGKMGDVTKEGRTVLFVSHNMAAVENLCQRAILLEQGKRKFEGATSEVVSHYMQSGVSFDESRVNLETHQGRISGNDVILREVEIFTNGQSSAELRMGGSLKVVTSFKSEHLITNMRFGISIENLMGMRVVVFSPTLTAPELIQEPLREGTIICDIPRLQLVPGLYYITLILANGSSDIDRVDQSIAFTVISSDVFNSGFALQSSHGIFYEMAHWQLSNIAS